MHEAGRRADPCKCIAQRISSARVAARYSGMVHGQQIAAELRSTDARSDIEFRELFRGTSLCRSPFYID